MVDTLVRFFRLHYILGLIVRLIILYHILELHEEGRTNPLGVSRAVDKVVFHEVFSVKDLLGVSLLLGVY